jgi:serine/threonine protein kinase
LYFAAALAIPSPAMVDDADPGETIRVSTNPPSLRGVGSAGSGETAARRAGDTDRREPAVHDTPAPLTPAPSVSVAVADEPPRTPGELARAADEPVHSPDVARRYRFGEVIGVGGMGEVVLAHDEHIDRDVAVKRIRSAVPSPEQRARFVREARVQGGLEHPAVVPVHDLAVDRDGRPFFVMKRLTGTTLLALLQRLRTGDEDESAARRSMLRAFVDVCLAIEFAHSRGIVHRDLKPANIMLGDFGEVYVLDWGVARAFGRRAGHPALARAAARGPRGGRAAPGDHRRRHRAPSGPDRRVRDAVLLRLRAVPAVERHPRRAVRRRVRRARHGERDPAPRAVPTRGDHAPRDLRQRLHQRSADRGDLADGRLVPHHARARDGHAARVRGAPAVRQDPHPGGHPSSASCRACSRGASATLLDSSSSRPGTSSR